MSNELPLPKSLQEAIIYFSDTDRCQAYAIKLRWRNSPITCPRCGSAEHSYISTRRFWFCKGCKKQFTIKVGTIMEDSPISLDKWMTAAWLICNCKNGISSYEIARDLKLTQKTAWFLDHRIRAAMHSGSFDKLKGEVEADETFIGGKARNMHPAKRKARITGTGGKDKTPVRGILERGGKVRTSVLPNRKKAAIQGEVRKHVQAGSAPYTDYLLSYEGLAGEFAHQVVDHAVEYVNGKIHTNGLENFWSLLKRDINGTYVSVESFHLFRYLDEQAFRYNNRKDDSGEPMSDSQRFEIAMGHVFGKRLTWNQLTGKTSDERTSVN